MPQRVLAFETSTRRGSCALWEGDRLAWGGSHERLNAHGEELPKLLEQCMAETGWSRGSLDRIAVGIGPGSFTGLRVGIALAQGIALGLGRPLVGIGSLEALAAEAPGVLRVALIDARRGELFVQAFDPGGQPLHEPVAKPRAEVSDWVLKQLTETPQWLGEPASELGLGVSTALPEAVRVAALAVWCAAQAFEPL
ncbi:MAG: tRNA (adenosine(37)-N6)-threonylcarbamoyltransferase complex dimerization subunit type 1 TsaB [Myxococcales bacterium]|nr:tRNA (adenosine(37)-N6)-threonylcarbamoyltransferase complex dimerization subunit type 1 TsaB [Myxococcales bacterium]